VKAALSRWILEPFALADDAAKAENLMRIQTVLESLQLVERAPLSSLASLIEELFDHSPDSYADEHAARFRNLRTH